MVQPQSGSVIIDGLKVKKDSLKQLFAGRLAMLPQNPQALFTEITVEEELLEELEDALEVVVEPVVPVVVVPVVPVVVVVVAVT